MRDIAIERTTSFAEAEFGSPNRTLPSSGGVESAPVFEASPVSDLLLVGHLAARSPMPDDWQGFLASELRCVFDAAASVICDLTWVRKDGAGLGARLLGPVVDGDRLDLPLRIETGDVESSCEGDFHAFILDSAPASAAGKPDYNAHVEASAGQLHGLLHYGPGEPALAVALARTSETGDFAESDGLRLHSLLDALAPFMHKRLRFVAAARTLTPRGVDVLDRAVHGRSEKQIADDLSVTRHTVHQYMKKIYAAFHVGTRAELLAGAIPTSSRPATASK